MQIGQRGPIPWNSYGMADFIATLIKDGFIGDTRAMYAAQGEGGQPYFWTYDSAGKITSATYTAGDEANAPSHIPFSAAGEGPITMQDMISFAFDAIARGAVTPQSVANAMNTMQPLLNAVVNADNSITITAVSFDDEFDWGNVVMAAVTAFFFAPAVIGAVGASDAAFVGDLPIAGDTAGTSIFTTGGDFVGDLPLATDAPGSSIYNPLNPLEDVPHLPQLPTEPPSPPTEPPAPPTNPFTMPTIPGTINPLTSLLAPALKLLTAAEAATKPPPAGYHYALQPNGSYVVMPDSTGAALDNLLGQNGGIMLAGLALLAFAATKSKVRH